MSAAASSGPSEKAVRSEFVLKARTVISGDEKAGCSSAERLPLYHEWEGSSVLVSLCLVPPCGL